MGPADDLGRACLMAQFTGGDSCCLGTGSHAEVVLDAADQQGEPAGGDEKFAVLAESDGLPKGARDFPEPVLSIGAKRVGVLVSVLAAQVEHRRVQGTELCLPGRVMVAAARRRFGSVRKLPSGQYQVRYYGPDGRRRSAPLTFLRKAEADRYLSLLEVQLARHEWVDPDRGRVRLSEYAVRWIEERPKLRPRTVQLYSWLLSRHIAPYIGDMPLSALDTPMVREWRSLLLGSGVSESVAAKAYRLLRAVLNTAVREDEILRVNPCRVPGADREEAGERPVLRVAQALELAELMPDRYRALVLVATFGCLRWGEVTALQRQDVDVDAMTVRVRQQFTELRGVGLVLSPPKSRAGVRTVTLPEAIGPAIRQHLATHVGGATDALVFTVPSGRPIWRGNFNPLVGWPAAVAAVGLPGLHFHDLRHTGNTLASSKTGTSLRDLMARMGHDSPRAALIYQHRTSEADRAIAQAVNEELEAAHRTAEANRGRDEQGRGLRGGGHAEGTEG